MSVTNAKQFLENLKKQVVYALVGKSGKWNESDTLDLTSVSDSRELENSFNDGILFKKTFPGQYTLAAIRNDWESGKVYDQYDGDDTDLASKVFHCINETGQVYKCLSNNLGAVSTEMPNIVTPAPFETSDGYVWKLVASVPETAALQFINTTLIPVKNVTEPSPGYELQYASQMAAIRGTVDRIDVVQGGKKYSQDTKVYIVGDGFGATATPDIHAITGEILSVKVNNFGRDYTNAVVTIVDPSNIPGEQGILKPILSPWEGHGSDPESELFASRVIGSITITGDEEGFIKDTFDYRQISLISGIEKSSLDPVQYSPNGSLSYINPSETFKQLVKSNIDVTDMIVKTNLPNIEFTVKADPATPYGDNEEWFTENGVSVAYLNGQWTIDFGSTLTASIVESKELTIYVELKKNATTVFGSVTNPSRDNTLNYNFISNDSTSNEPLKFVTYSDVDDTRYDYTIKAVVDDVSGDFERGETLTFLNGGSAILVYFDAENLYLSSPQAIMTGSIQGASSGATAKITELQDRPFKPSGEVIYSHYLDKHTKIVDQNLKISPIFSF